MSANILVAGAAGFIGSHVCSELVRKQRRVVALDDLSGGFVENVAQGVSRVAAWAKKTGIRQGQTFDAVEVKKTCRPRGSP